MHIMLNSIRENNTLEIVGYLDEEVRSVLHVADLSEDLWCADVKNVNVSDTCALTCYHAAKLTLFAIGAIELDVENLNVTVDINLEIIDQLTEIALVEGIYVNDLE